MADETKSQPVVIDAATFSPAPGNVFEYQGKKFKAFNILQVRRATRNRFAELNAHLKGCNSIDEQADMLAEMLHEFVPGLPASIRDESWELLLQAVLRLGNSIGSDGDARPTKGRRKSSKRANARS